MNSKSTDFGPERRSKPRIYKPFHARVRAVNARGEAFEALTVLDNMSSSGLYLRIGENVERGEKVHLVIQLATTHSRIVPAANVAVEGIVVRSDVQANGSYGLGIAISSHRFV